MNESLEFSEYDKHNDRHQPRQKCDFCGLMQPESWVKRIDITADDICEDCIRAMTLEQAIKYVKGQEDYPEPKHLISFINQLFPQHALPESDKKNNS